MLELMLLKDVTGLGDAGDVVRVRNGYARNYLLPRRLAAPVSHDAVRQAEAHRRRVMAQLAKRREEAAAQIEKLSNMSIHVEVRAAEGGTLYGSVTAAMIAESITKEGVAVTESHVELAEPIKELGIYDVNVTLVADLSATVKLYVVQPAPPPE